MQVFGVFEWINIVKDGKSDNIGVETSWYFLLRPFINSGPGSIREVQDEASDEAKEEDRRKPSLGRSFLLLYR